MLRKRFSFVCLAVLFGWIVAELAIVSSGILVPAAFRDRQRLLHGLFEPDPVLGFRARANLRDFEVRWSETGERALYSTDEQGFRDVGRDPSKADLLFLGDSFTWGVWLPREQTFPDLIGAKLGVPVANWARESYYIEQYALLADRFIAEHDPKVVVVCVFANDLTAPISAEQLATFYESFGWDRYRSYPLHKRSAAYQLWLKVSPPAAAETAPHLEHREMANGLRLYAGLGAHPHYESAGYNVAIETRFRVMLQSIRNAGAAALVVLLPSKESTNHEAYGELFERAYLGIEERAYASLAAIAAEEGAHSLDLTPVFRRRGREPPTYLPIDPHWNAAGHVLAAESILQYLEGILEGNPPDAKQSQRRPPNP